MSHHTYTICKRAKLMGKTYKNKNPYKSSKICTCIGKSVQVGTVVKTPPSVLVRRALKKVPQCRFSFHVYSALTFRIPTSDTH